MVPFLNFSSEAPRSTIVCQRKGSVFVCVSVFVRERERMLVRVRDRVRVFVRVSGREREREKPTSSKSSEKKESTTFRFDKLSLFFRLLTSFHSHHD